MIHKILMRISAGFQSSEPGQQDLHAYQEMNSSKGWKIHQAMLATIGNEIAMYMLSKEYTELSAQEKDIQQRTFFMAKELIEFLMNPIQMGKPGLAIRRHNEEMAKKIQATR